MRRIDEYQIYHQRVVEECTNLMGEDSRDFYQRETYFAEFDQGTPPRRVAEDQLAAMRQLVAEADGQPVKRRKLRVI